MKFFVFTELGGATPQVGHVFTQSRRGRLSSTFAYDTAYMATPGAYAIDPQLPLSEGMWPVTTALPRAFLDAAPDRWGRNLIDRRAAMLARLQGTPLPALNDVDYLLGVSDFARQGALRFRRTVDGPFEHPDDDVPPLLALPKLQAAAAAVVADDEAADDAVKTLLDLGSASLGGARPKASVRDSGRLLMAKFGHAGDRWDVIAWEAAALDLAQQAGVEVPDHELRIVGGRPVLLTRRFDRDDTGRRIGYMSAMTLCQADDGERRDYLDIAEAVGVASVNPEGDLEQLWRRVAFSVAINNVDDHLRNHGLLRRGSGWQLSPAFDLNPDPNPGAAHATSIGGAVSGADIAASLVQMAPLFGVTNQRAARIIDEVLDATANWQAVAARNGVASSEFAKFAETFQSGQDALRNAVG